MQVSRSARLDMAMFLEDGLTDLLNMAAEYGLDEYKPSLTKAAAEAKAAVLAISGGQIPDRLPEGERGRALDIAEVRQAIPEICVSLHKLAKDWGFAKVAKAIDEIPIKPSPVRQSH